MGDVIIDEDRGVEMLFSATLRGLCAGAVAFLNEGHLSGLEIYSYEDPISPFPPRDRLICDA